MKTVLLTFILSLFFTSTSVYADALDVLINNVNMIQKSMSMQELRAHVGEMSGHPGELACENSAREYAIENGIIITPEGNFDGESKATIDV
jgi:hypothetical protein